MADSKTAAGAKDEVKNIVLRDLQSVLRGPIGDGLIVESFTSESLLPPGENYGSTILSVRATIRRGESAPKENLNLIAKMPPPTDFQRRVFDSPYTFRKEIFMYESLLPMYNRLETEHGVPRDEIFDVLPKFYGSRLSMDPNVDFDDDAVILMENLKERGYYTGVRSIGYDLEHSKLAIRAVARFHALGMAMKYNKPDQFDVLKQRAKCINFGTDDFQDMHITLLKKIRDIPEISMYHDRCAELIAEVPPTEMWMSVPAEPWSSIIHSDFWVNNILFHRDQNARVDDVKFVDFQNYLFLNPIRELIFFLFSSVDTGVSDNDIEELVDLYHETLFAILGKMGCDTSPFTRDKFDGQLRGAAKLEFLHLSFMLKVLTLDVQESKLSTSNINEVLLNYEGSRTFDDRLIKIVLYFGKREWI